MQAFARYAFENKDGFATVTQPYSSKLDVPIFARNQNIASESHSYLVAASCDRISNCVPTYRLGLARRPAAALPRFFIENEGEVTLPSASDSYGGPHHSYQFFQTVTWARGRHTLKFGGQFVHLRENISLGFSDGQVADAHFLDVQAFVNGVLGFYHIALNPKGQFPGRVG